MPDFGPDDPLTAAIQGRGSVYNLDTATQPGQGALDQRPTNFQIDPVQQIQNRRQVLLQQLPYTNRRNAYAIHAELGALDQNERQMHWEASQRRLMAHDQAEMAAKMLKVDRETSIDEQGAALMNGLGRLDALHRNGRINSEQFDAGVLDLGQQYQLGTRHPTAGKMFEHYVTEADKRNAFNVRRLTSETAKLGARYGVEPKIDPDTGLPSLELTKAAALQTDKGKAEIFKQMNDEMFQKYGVGTGVNSLFNPIVPHEDAGGGKNIKLPFLNKGKVEAIEVPKPLFNLMKADFNDRYFSIVGQPAQQQASVDPKVSLAQKALNDPNASEAHKAAAKRILGLQ